MRKKERDTKKPTPKFSDLVPEDNLSSDEIIRECRSLNAPDIFNLGCQEKFHLSISEQQCRAIKLAFAIRMKELLRPDSSVAVIGGNVSGCTIAVALGLLGYKVVIFERESEILKKFADSNHRWIHPNYFTAGIGVDDWTSLPIMNWKSDTADKVARLLRLKFNSYLSSLESNIDIIYNSKVTGISLQYDHRFLNPISSIRSIDSVEGKKHPGDRSFDLTIIATGFGDDSIKQEVKGGKSISTPSYWKKVKKIRTKDKVKLNLLISGCGDGGLVELFNACLTDFKHQDHIRLVTLLPSRSVKWFMQQQDDFHREIAEIEELKDHDFQWIKMNSKITGSLRRFKINEIKKIEMRIAKTYRAFAKDFDKFQPEISKLIKSHIDKNQKIYLNSRSCTPYNPFTAVWNKMFLAVLEFHGAFEFIEGELKDVAITSAKRYKVNIWSYIQGTQRTILIDHLIQRYGQNKEFEHVFENIIFNQMPKVLRQNHEEDNDLFEAYEAFVDSKGWKVIRKNESIQSIHSWLKNVNGRKQQKPIFKFSKYGKQLHGVTKARLVVKAYLKFIKECREFDQVGLDVANVVFDESFVNEFELLALKAWSVRYPRVMFKTDVLTNDLPIEEFVRKLFDIPHKFHEDYMRNAENLLS